MALPANWPELIQDLKASGKGSAYFKEQYMQNFNHMATDASVSEMDRRMTSQAFSALNVQLKRRECALSILYSTLLSFFGDGRYRSQLVLNVHHDDETGVPIYQTVDCICHLRQKDQYREPNLWSLDIEVGTGLKKLFEGLEDRVSDRIYHFIWLFEKMFPTGLLVSAELNYRGDGRYSHRSHMDFDVGAITMVNRECTYRVRSATKTFTHGLKSQLMRQHGRAQQTVYGMGLQSLFVEKLPDHGEMESVLLVEHGGGFYSKDIFVPEAVKACIPGERPVNSDMPLLEMMGLVDKLWLDNPELERIMGSIRPFKEKEIQWTAPPQIQI